MDYDLVQISTQTGMAVLWDQRLNRVGQLDAGLRDVQRVRMSGRGQVMVIGKDHDGHTRPVVLDVVRREVHPLEPLPTNALLRTSTYDVQAKRWAISYATTDKPDEEHFHAVDSLVRDDIHYVTAFDPVTRRATMSDGFPFDD